MSRDEFEDALARYGADFSRWPTDSADRGRALAADDRGAEAALAAAQRLDALLAETARPVTVDAAMIGRIVAGIAGGHAHETAVRPTGKLFAWAGAAMAMFLVVGFVIGLAVPAVSNDDDALATLMFGGGGVGLGAVDGGIL
jgi:hypothetical protein